MGPSYLLYDTLASMNVYVIVYKRSIDVLGEGRRMSTRQTWLTVADVARRLQVTEETVRRWIRAGDLSALNLGGRKGGYRIRRADLATFIDSRYIRAKGVPDMEETGASIDLDQLAADWNVSLDDLMGEAERMVNLDQIAGEFDVIDGHNVLVIDGADQVDGVTEAFRDAVRRGVIEALAN